MERVDGFIFTELELLCLASLVGMNRIYGYEYLGSDSLKKDIHYAIYGLAKKKYIYMEETTDDIHVNSEPIRIFNILKQPQYVFDVLKEATNERIIIYKGKDNESVFVRQNSTQCMEVVVGIILSDYIVRFLVDEGYIKYLIKDDLGERRVIRKNENIRVNNKEDRLLYIKKINEKYNIDDSLRIEIYESCIYDKVKKESLELTYKNLQSIF